MTTEDEPRLPIDPDREPEQSAGATHTVTSQEPNSAGMASGGGSSLPGHPDAAPQEER